VSEPGEAPPEAAQVGRPGSFLAGCAIGVCVLLIVGVVVVWRGKKAEDERREQTLVTLRRLHRLVATTTPRDPPRADGTGDDWTGMKALAAGFNARAGTFERCVMREGHLEVANDDLGFSYPTTDGWDHPIRYRCPGVVHRRGFDFYSCGPNGKDDEGTFDDLVEGEDVAAVASPR
jgi:hypothetical protein